MKFGSLRFGLTFFVSVSVGSVVVMGEPPPLPDPHASLSPPPPTTSPPPLPRPAPASIPPVPAMAPQPTIQANNKPLTVPPPQPAQEIPAPRIPPHLPTTAPRSAVEIQRLTPVVEIWRASARAPQVPARRGDHVTDAYIADNQPVMVRLQFDPSARGKTVFVRPGPGALIEGTTDTRRINPVGECIVTLRMAPNVNHSHVSFHCAGLMTTLTLARNSQARVEASEALVSGGRR